MASWSAASLRSTLRRRGSPLDVDARFHTTRTAPQHMVFSDARGRDDGVRQELVAGVVLRSGGRSAFGGQSGKHLPDSEPSGFDRVVGPGADIPSPEQLVAAHIPLPPFQDPDGCEPMPCVVLSLGGDYEAPGVHHPGRRPGGAVPPPAAPPAAAVPGVRFLPWAI